MCMNAGKFSLFIFYLECISLSNIPYINFSETIAKTSNESIHKIIEKIGDWPMATNKPWNPVDFDWMEATVKLRWLGISSDAFLKIQPMIDIFNNTIYRIGVRLILYSIH